MTPDELSNDETLRRTLRDLSPTPPLDAVDWDALRIDVMRRARPLLRRQPAWWQLIAGWSRPGIPLTAAAAAVLALTLGTAVLRPARDAAAVTTVAFRTVEEELERALPDDTRDILQADADAMLDQLLLAEGTAW